MAASTLLTPTRLRAVSTRAWVNPISTRVLTTAGSAYTQAGIQVMSKQVGTGLRGMRGIVEQTQPDAASNMLTSPGFAMGVADNSNRQVQM
jgi:hypothetical protein